MFKRLNWFQWLMLFGIAVVVFRNSYFFEYELIGTYISNAKAPILGYPAKGEELILLEEGEYISTSLGNGTYVIEGNSIHLYYGGSGWGFNLYREFNIGKPRLSFNADLGHYLIKQ